MSYSRLAAPDKDGFIYYVVSPRGQIVMGPYSASGTAKNARSNGYYKDGTVRKARVGELEPVLSKDEELAKSHAEVAKLRAEIAELKHRLTKPEFYV